MKGGTCMSEASTAEVRAEKVKTENNNGFARGDVLFFNLLMLFMLIAFTTVIVFSPRSGSLEMFVTLACLIVNLIAAYNIGLQRGLLLSIVFTFAYGSYVIYNAGLSQSGADVVFGHILWMIFFPLGAVLAGNLALIVARFRHGMESKNALEKLVAIDDKTGFYKENEFFKQLDEEFVRAVRYKTPLSVLLIQITNYEELAIIYGDVDIVSILKTVSEYLTKSLRLCDTKFLIANDTLCVILASTDEAGAKVVLEKLHLSLEQVTTTIGGGVKKVVRIKPSIGYSSLIHERDRDALEIYERAKTELSYDRG